MQAAAQDEWLGGCIIYPSEVDAAAQGAATDDVASAYGKEAATVLQEAAALQEEAADEEEEAAERRPLPAAAAGALAVDTAPEQASAQRLRLLRVKIALAAALRRVGRDGAAKHQLEEVVFRLRILNEQDALKGGALGGLEALTEEASAGFAGPAGPYGRLLLELEVDKEALLADALVQVRALCVLLPG